MQQNAIKRAEAYIEAEDAFTDARQSTAYHAGLREHVPAAISVIKAVGWGAVVAWRFAALFRTVNKENIKPGVPNEDQGVTRATAEAIIAEDSQ